ncbi:FtsX-like permease family protein [Streptomyces marincola]|uniref:ABC3 transporter permease C-terminal domain-containing protein n=1 Tax=Streptomyces marincola TaxID=2878388 RepID=A0A1W7CWL9_9ACTN|nr:FtsX-like permease family protein [Streptomyces marincola]ARQ69224.1 hypothetical protein CAG99_10440 [Streptomyces marincola]
MNATATTWRLALRLARSPHPRQRLRAVLLGTTAAVVAVTALFTAGLLHMLGEERQRFEARSMEFTASAEDAVLRVDQRTDSWGTTSYPVVWFDPVDEADPRALPPGLASWPEPGGWAVSPGLVELAGQHPELAERFPNAHVLADEGVRHPGELLAYRLMPEGGALGAGAVWVTGFGGGTIAIGEDTELDLTGLTLAISALIVLPLVLLAATATAVSAPPRAHRLALLRALGVPRRRRRRLVVAEAAFIVLPGLALGSLVWALAGPRVTGLPVVDRPVADWALVPPWWSFAAVLTVLAVLFAVLTVAGERRRRPGEHAATPRPRAGRPRLALVRTAPVAAGLALLAAAFFRDGASSTTTTLAGALLLAAGVPLALPVIARRAGERIARGATAPARMLAGRRLQYDPRSAVRPLYGIAALLVLSPVIAAWSTTVRELDPPVPPDPTAEAVEVRGALEHADADALLRDLPGAVAAPLTYTDTGSLRLGATCSQLARLLERPACAAEGDLLPEAEERIERLLGHVSFSVTLVRGEVTEPTSRDSLLVIAPRDPDFEPAVRAAALAQPAALTVTSETDRQLTEPALVAWIFGGVTLFGALVFLLLSVGLIDRSAAGRRGGRLLSAFGVTPRGIRGINAQEFLLGYAIVAGTGLAAGVVATAAWNAANPRLAFPLAFTALTALAAVALACVGLLGVRLTHRDASPAGDRPA